MFGDFFYNQIAKLFKFLISSAYSFLSFKNFAVTFKNAVFCIKNDFFLKDGDFIQRIF